MRAVNECPARYLGSLAEMIVADLHVCYDSHYTVHIISLVKCMKANNQNCIDHKFVITFVLISTSVFHDICYLPLSLHPDNITYVFIYITGTFRCYHFPYLQAKQKIFFPLKAARRRWCNCHIYCKVYSRCVQCMPYID